MPSKFAVGCSSLLGIMVYYTIGKGSDSSQVHLSVDYVKKFSYFARGHYTVGKEVVDSVLGRIRMLTDMCIGYIVPAEPFSDDVRGKTTPVPQSPLAAGEVVAGTRPLVLVRLLVRREVARWERWRCATCSCH